MNTPCAPQMRTTATAPPCGQCTVRQYHAATLRTFLRNRTQASDAVVELDTMRLWKVSSRK